MAHYKRIRDLREDSDLTQTEIANYLKTTPQYYGKYESGEREIPFYRAIELADYYKVSLDYMAGRTNVRSIAGDITINKPGLNDEEARLLEYYRQLPDRNKGKVDLFAKQLFDSDKKH